MTDTTQNDPFVVAGRTFRSRLMVGTGKFPSAEALKASLEGCDAEIVTVAPGTAGAQPVWLDQDSQKSFSATTRIIAPMKLSHLQKHSEED